MLSLIEEQEGTVKQIKMHIEDRERYAESYMKKREEKVHEELSKYEHKQGKYISKREEAFSENSLDEMRSEEREEKKHENSSYFHSTDSPKTIDKSDDIYYFEKPPKSKIKDL